MKYLGKIAGAMCLSLAAVSATSGESEAATYYFGVITDPNNASYTIQNVNAAQAAFKLETSSANPASTDVLFTFSKITDDDAALTQIYFDVTPPQLVGSGFSIHDDSDGIGSYTNQGGGGPKSGVEYAAGSGNLPGGNQPGVGFSADASADPLSPVSKLGLEENGEWVTIKYDGTAAAGYSLTLADIDALMQNLGPSLSVGIHVQSLPDNDGSLSLINIPVPNQTPPPAIPLPASLILLLSALGGLGFLGRHRVKA